MVSKIFSIAIIAGIFFSSCNTTAKNTDNTKQRNANGSTPVVAVEQDIPYTIGNRYFVNNTYKNGDLMDPKITTREQFEKIFGMATIMGPNGKPTAIDFSRQYVLSVIGDLTDRSTKISLISLKQNANTILLNYKITEGEITMATVRPMLLIIVDNEYQGEVKLVKVSS